MSFLNNVADKLTGRIPRLLNGVLRTLHLQLNLVFA